MAAVQADVALRDANEAASRTIKVRAAQLAAQQTGGIPRAVLEAAAAPLVDSALTSARQQWEALAAAVLSTIFSLVCCTISCGARRREAEARPDGRAAGGGVLGVGRVCK